jgi:hypothetical protein
MKKWLFFFLFSFDHSNASLIDAYVVYGQEQKYDTLPGVVNRQKYIGGIINYEEVLELHYFMGTGTTTNRGHMSANLHFPFYSEIRPFFNLGIGKISNNNFGTHLNFDIGIEYVESKYRVRVMHKTQNRFWSNSQYGLAMFLVSVGYQFSFN